MKTTECNKCNRDIKNCNFKRHVTKCDGIIYHTNTNCPYCNISYDMMSLNQKGNHTRWCEKNPKLSEHKQKTSQNCLKFLRSEDCAEKRTQSREKQSVGAKKAHAEGRYDHIDYGSFSRGRKHSEETKKKQSISALASNHRRLVKSTRPYTQKNGIVILIDSSWEEIVAKRLDELNIEWIRPKDPLKWIDKTGKKRNYFPDFYLIDYDLYLDPKNPCAYNQQIEKVTWFLNNTTNVKFILNIEDCKNFSI